MKIPIFKFPGHWPHCTCIFFSPFIKLIHWIFFLIINGILTLVIRIVMLKDKYLKTLCMNYKCYIYEHVYFFVSTCNSNSYLFIYLIWEVICLSVVHINIFTALEQYMISLFWLSPVYLFCAVCYVVLHFPLSCMPRLPINATTLPMNRLLQTCDCFCVLSSFTNKVRYSRTPCTTWMRPSLHSLPLNARSSWLHMESG